MLEADRINYHQAIAQGYQTQQPQMKRAKQRIQNLTLIFGLAYEAVIRLN